MDVDQSRLLICRTAEANEFLQSTMNATQLRVDHTQTFIRVLVSDSPLQHLHDGADRCQRISDFMSNAGGQQPKRRLFFLLNQQSL